MPSCPWRDRIICGGLLYGSLFVLASIAAVRLSSRSSYCPALLACSPRLIVSGSGELGHRGSLLPAVVCLVPAGGALRGSLLRSNEETGTMRRCVDYVNCLSSVDWHGCRGVYSISCLIDGASAVFVGFLSRCLISPGKACGCFAPARSRVFSFLRERRGRFFFINAISLNTYSGAACLPVPRLRFNGINA